VSSTVAGGPGIGVDKVPDRAVAVHQGQRHVVVLRFHTYDRVPPTPRVEELLVEVDRDPMAIFWG